MGWTHTYQAKLRGIEKTVLLVFSFPIGTWYQGSCHLAEWRTWLLEVCFCVSLPLFSSDNTPMLAYSLEGLLQENGPFLWQYGTAHPVPNPYAWNKQVNVLWVEQPVGTGFTQGVPNIHDEHQLA